jgi:hypothetical protein
MSLTSEEIQKTLEATIKSMQKNMDDERKKYKDKIDNLEEQLLLKDTEINDLKEKLRSAIKKKQDKETIDNLQIEKDCIQKELQIKITEYRTALINISTLTNQLEIEKQNIMNLNLEKKQLKEQLDTTEKTYLTVKNQIIILQKQIDGHTEEISKCNNEIKNKDIIIENLNKKIEEINKSLKESEENNNGLLKYIKDIKENEEMIKKEREEIKNEREEYNKLKQEMIKKENEYKKQLEMEKLIKKEEKEEIISKEEIKEINLEEGQEKIIADLLCEFLLKLKSLQYYISLFDLLDKSLKHYDELKYIDNLNSTKHESMNDILYNFYESLNSYFLVQGENANFNDFLLQKSFRLTDIGKEDIEIIKTINSLKLGKEINILDLYRKKRELYFKSKEFTFKILKEKILGEKKIITNDNDEFLKITKPPLELQVNFDEIINNNYSLVKYQVHNIFNKLRELTIHISNIPIFLLYSLIVNCHNLNTLKIIFIKDKLDKQNNINIEKLNDICPIILNYLKQLTSFSLINLPLSSNKLSQLVESLKISKIKKLSLINCFTKKEDTTLIIPYFSQNILTEIDLSNHFFHFPSLLNNSLLNYNINKQLISICFNNCQLNEDDIKYISNYIVSSNSILICDIGKNILSPLACSTFGYCILKTTSLETLRINECGINGESLLFIFNGKGSKPLKHVNLNGNEFGDIGLVSISAFMKNSPLLESIELEKCGGTDMGFISLANMIQGNTNSKIKYVNFHKNNVTVASLGILKKFNDVFTSRKVVFALDKMEGQNDNIDCAVFT